MLEGGCQVRLLPVPGAHGGLWESTNAGNQNSNPASVVRQALIDDQPTLAVEAVAWQSEKQRPHSGRNRRDSHLGRFLLRTGNSAFHKRRYLVDADPERNEWAIFSRYGLPQDCIQHRESQPGGSGDGGRQRRAPRPGSVSSATAAFVTVAAPTALGQRRLRLQPRQ